MNLKNTILEDKNFLDLTLQNENGFPSSATAGSFVLHGHLQVDIPATGVIVFTPMDVDEGTKSKDVVLSSGVHGNETGPLEMCNGIIRGILSGEVIVKHRVMFLFGNPVAINLGKRLSEENLNRLFGVDRDDMNKPEDNCEQRRATLLRKQMKLFFSEGNGEERVHYDLHTAMRGSVYEKFAIYPFRHGAAYSKQQLEFLWSSGVKTIILANQPGTTFSYYSSKMFDAHAFTIELGKVMPLGENDLSKFSAIDNNLRCLLEDKPIITQPFDNDDFNIFRVHTELIKKTEKFRLHIDNDYENFTKFPVGHLLADDESNGEKYCTQHPGETLVFPNVNVVNGQRAAVVIVPSELEF